MKVAVVGLILLFVSLLFFIFVGRQIPCEIQPVSYAVAVGIILSLVGASLGGTATFRTQFKDIPVAFKVGGGSAFLIGAMFLTAFVIHPECNSKEFSIRFNEIPVDLKTSGPGGTQVSMPVDVQFDPTDVRTSHTFSSSSLKNYAAFPRLNEAFVMTVRTIQDKPTLQCQLRFERADTAEKAMIELRGVSTPEGMKFDVSFSIKNCFKVRTSSKRDIYPTRLVFVERSSLDILKSQINEMFNRGNRSTLVAIYAEPPVDDPAEDRAPGKSLIRAVSAKGEPETLIPAGPMTHTEPAPTVAPLPAPSASAPPASASPPRASTSATPSISTAPSSPPTAPAASRPTPSPLPAPSASAPPDSASPPRASTSAAPSISTASSSPPTAPAASTSRPTPTPKAPIDLALTAAPTAPAGLDNFWSEDSFSDDQKRTLLKSWASVKAHIWPRLSKASPWTDEKKQKVLLFIRDSIRQEPAWSTAVRNRRPRAGQSGTCDEHANIDCRRDFTKPLPLIDTLADQRIIFELLANDDAKVRNAAQSIIRSYPQVGFGRLFEEYRASQLDTGNKERLTRIITSALYYYYNQIVENRWNKVLDSPAVSQ